MIVSSFLTNKPEGSTPLEALEQLRVEKGIVKDVPMTYAGRLDPMAEGLLLILVGDECKKKDEYLGLDKEYEVEVLLGVGSDTGDVLGKLKTVESKQKIVISKQKIIDAVKLLIGKRSEKYPAFSSRTVNGKPLFMHARNIAEQGESIKLVNAEMPEKEIEIYSADFINMHEISLDELVQTAKERIAKVKGDFRQEKILDSWEKMLSTNLNAFQKFQIVQLRIRSSSGAYMRTLAQKLGESLEISALAWKIKRTKIGDYTLN